MPDCLWCKKDLPLAAFETKPNSDPYKTCAICRPKKNAANSKYHGGETGQATSSTYWKSPQGKKIRKTYNAGSGGKAARKKWSDSEKGEAYKEVSNERQKDKYHSDYSTNLNLRLVAAFKLLVKPELPTESIHLPKTSFKSVRHFRKHYSRLFQGTEMNWSNHGSLWWNGHHIPRVYFDHANAEDVKRCWSPANMFPQLIPSNRRAVCRIDVNKCAEMGAEWFPLSWDGKLPTEEEAEEMYLAVRAKK